MAGDPPVVDSVIPVLMVMESVPEEKDCVPEVFDEITISAAFARLASEKAVVVKIIFIFTDRVIGFPHYLDRYKTRMVLPFNIDSL